MVDCRDHWRDTVSSLAAILSLAIPATFWAKVTSLDSSYDFTIKETFWT